MDFMSSSKLYIILTWIFWWPASIFADENHF